tara:strand:+ start:49 stop:1317 length:1269 start_codon:yes stop_codon:yes gene_type:complete
MVKSINRRMAELVTQSGKVANSALTNLDILDSADIISIANSTSAATAVFETLDSLPTTSLSAGQQAFVNENNRLYISNGTGWYNLTFINRTPTWFTEPDATYEIADSATPLIVTARATDSDNSIAQLVNQSVVSDSAQYMVNISNDSSVWTFTPKSADSIGIEVAAGNLTDSNGDFEYTFKWSDGVNFVSKASTISYNPAPTAAAAAYRGGSQAVWGTFGASPVATYATLPSGTQVGDKGVIVLGGLGYPSTQVTISGAHWSKSHEYEWGYNSSATGYGTQVWEATISSNDISNGFIQLNQSDGSTSYKMATLLTFSSGTTPIFNHARINYGSHTNGVSYTVASAAPPTGYLSKTGLLEVHTTREGYRTYSSATNGTLMGTVNRHIYYIQALYQASSLAQQYHRFTYNGGAVYSSSSVTIAW